MLKCKILIGFLILMIIIVLLVLFVPKKENYKPGDVSGKWKLTFFDDFSNGLSQWGDPMTGLDTLSHSCALYSSDNVKATSDGMVISVGPTVAGKDNCKGWDNGSQKTLTADSCVKSGRIQSNFAQKYGLFIWTAKVPRGPNLWPALWLTNAEHWPQTGEIDVMEVVDSADKRDYFTSRIMVPIDSHQSKYVGVSIPPDDKEDDQIYAGGEGWWNNFHTFALNWYPDGKGDFIYEFYLDIQMKNGQIVDMSGNVASPNKKYSLSELVNKWGRYKPAASYPPKYNLSSAKDIDSWVKPQHIVCNVAIGGWWGAQCGGDNCSPCNNTTGEMIVKNVQVWKYQN